MKSELIVRIDKDAQSGDVYTLVRPFSRCGVTVPAGFRSDGASVPRFFWRCVFPPRDDVERHLSEESVITKSVSLPKYKQLMFQQMNATTKNQFQIERRPMKAYDLNGTEFDITREEAERIAEGRARIVEIMADALRFGVTWADLIAAVA